MKKIQIIAVIACFILMGVGCAHRTPMIGAGADLPGMSYQDYLQYKNQSADTAKATQAEAKTETAEAVASTEPVKKEKTGKVEAPPRVQINTQTANSGSLEDRVAQLENQVEKNTQGLGHLTGVVSFNIQRVTAIQDQARDGEVLAKQKVNFALGSGTQIVANTNKAMLDRLIKKGMTPKVIVGVTDPTGNSKANARLAQERAESLKAYLEKNGINVSGAKILAKPEAYLYGTCGPQNRAAVVYYK